MKISPHIPTLCQKALVDSMSTELMVVLVRKLIPNYDLNERTGFPDSIPVPKKDAAVQIIRDIRDDNYILKFINLLVDMHVSGHMGREHPISNIKTIIREMYDSGYLYDQSYKMFIENPKFQKTMNWGVIRNGDELITTFIRIDIVGNSTLVRENSQNSIDEAYDTLRAIFENAIERRNGRIWCWEGDGGLAAFIFSNRELYAMLAAMEIIHELFIFNRTASRLNKELAVRIAVHSGPCMYSNNIENLKKNETIKKVIEIETKFAKPNTITLSNTTFQHFDEIILKQLQLVNAGQNVHYYNYELRWGD
jgi:hypothetical protein